MIIIKKKLNLIKIKEKFVTRIIDFRYNRYQLISKNFIEKYYMDGMPRNN